ncbi:MAG: SUMF1/EgtB/PvdO family nonheme iron enzyme [Myxococcota bacterium]
MTPAEARDALRDAWSRTDQIFDMLTPEAWRARPIPLRHPFVFYLGHLPAFAFNQVGRGVLTLPSFQPEFDALFERGIDPLDEAAAAEFSVAEWPPAEQILAYRDRVRATLLETVDAVAARSAGDPLAAGLRIHHVVLEHELMHQETLLYMVQALPSSLKRRQPEIPQPATGPAPATDRISIPAGRVRLGVDLGALPFAWDAETGHADLDVPAFAIDNLPVTVGRFAEFVDAGGYSDHRFWRPEAWSWRQRAGLEHPSGWRRHEHGSFEVAWLLGHLPLSEAASWPAQVSQGEAAAYARWRKARLPTEAELHRAAFTTPDGQTRSYPWGSAPPDPSRGSFDFNRFSPAPVGSTPQGQSAWGVEELVGNGWEHTSTIFAPHPGFEAWIRTYPAYASDFFDGQHTVVFGASWATHARLLRPSFRNWYQRQYPYPFTAFRCVYPEVP